VQQRDFESAWPLISSVRGHLAPEEAAVLHSAAARVPVGHWIVEIGTDRGRSTAAIVSGKQPDVPVLAIDPYLGGPTAASPPEAMRAFCENMERVGAGPEVQLFWGTSEQAARSRALVFQAAAARGGGRHAAAASAEHTTGDVHDGPAPCDKRVFRVEAPSPATTAGQNGHADSGGGSIGLLFIDGAHDVASVLRDIDLWEGLVAVGGTVVFHDAFLREGVTLALFKRHFFNSEFRYERSVVNTSIFRRTGPLRTTAKLASGLRMTARVPQLARNEVISLGVHRDWRWLQRLFPPSPDFEYYWPPWSRSRPSEPATR
jgi:predicted O-methyltransferase YrrM